MKFDLSAPIMRHDGVALLDQQEQPLTVRVALLMALDSQPTEAAPGHERRQRPATIAEVRERLAIEAKIPDADASDPHADLTAEDVTLLQNLVLNSLPVPVGKFVVRFFGAPQA